jgi:hypothetical protein
MGEVIYHVNRAGRMVAAERGRDGTQRPGTKRIDLIHVRGRLMWQLGAVGRFDPRRTRLKKRYSDMKGCRVICGNGVMVCDIVTSNLLG